MFSIILLTPILLSLFSLITNKKRSYFVLKFSSFLYLLLSILIIYLYYIWYNNTFWIFFTNFNLNLNTYLNVNVIFILLISVLAFLIWWYSIYYFKKELDHKVIWYTRLKQYNIFINLFIFAMLFVASTNNILVMWIAIEATTIFTTFLISFYWTNTSWEAAWKYIILCSVGLTVGLFWIILLIIAGLTSLDITNINFENINILLTKLAFIFSIIWFWTKVWLFPMNSWLPDAHGKASTPVSAFMSSILLPLALYIIFKIKVIVDLMLGSNLFTNDILLTFWIVTLLYSWFILIQQKHFKRTLAYSSTENMWILVMSLWIWSPLALKLWLLHLIAHSFLKTSSFMSVWNVLLEQKTWQFHKISDLLKNQRITSIIMIISILMLVWVPISPLFISEIWLIFTLFIKNIYLSFIVIFSFILIFSWILINFSKLFEKKENTDTKFIDEKYKLNSIFTPILLTLVIGISSIASLLFIL